jgi:hypothetical protein
MDCETFEKLIQGYLREEFDGVLGNEFRWHKHFCDRCRDLYKTALLFMSRKAYGPETVSDMASS